MYFHLCSLLFKNYTLEAAPFPPFEELICRSCQCLPWEDLYFLQQHGFQGLVCFTGRFILLILLALHGCSHIRLDPFSLILMY